MARLRRLPAVWLAVALGLGAGPMARAAPEPTPRLADAEARDIAKQITRLARKPDPAPLLEVLNRIGPASHEDLAKPLVSLLTHRAPQVALQAAEKLRIQVVESERDREKLARTVWKAGWADRANARRYAVRGRSLRAYVVLLGELPSDRELREVVQLWEARIGDPHRDDAPALVEISRYARESKDKRLCRHLAEEIDQPLATDVNSPSNPPAEWWQRRWEMWREYHAEVVEALEALTGEHFKTTQEAKAWFEANEKDFGFRWSG